jgi:hypothetical protein
MFSFVYALEIPGRSFYKINNLFSNGSPGSTLGGTKISFVRLFAFYSLAPVLAFGLLAPVAGAQQLEAGVSSSAVAPETSADPSAAPPAPATPKSNGALYGTVLDSNNGVIAGAKVTLSGPVTRTVTSDSGGNFSFTGLPAGTFSIQVSGPGMSPASVPAVELRQGGVRFLPPIVLQVAAASTSVKVYANPEQLAEEQLELQLHQKVLGFLPNYYSSYDWNAVHLWPKQKLKIGYRSELDPVTFVIIAGEAGLDQMSNRYAGYGSGIQGYAKRYGADYTTDFTGTMIGDVVLPSLFHQDPRYFLKGSGSFGSRTGYALSRTFIVRGDNKRPQFAYSRVLGDLAAGAIANTYYPADSRGVRLVFTSAAVDLGANAATNLIREFILPGLTSHVPKGIKAKSPIQIHF